MTGNEIRAACRSAGISLRELARRAFLNVGYLSQIERGLRTPSAAVLRRLSDVLEHDLSRPEPLRAALALLTSTKRTTAPDTTDAVHQLRLLDDEVGGVDSYPVVASALTTVAEPAVYAEVAQIAGWVAADAGRHGAAQLHYIRGVQAATEGGNRTAGANCLSSLAYLMAGTRDAVLLAEAAARVPDLPATMACLVAERLAWAHATIGDADGCYRALDAADSAWIRRGPDEAEPKATYWLSEPEIEIMRGRCYVQLRRPLRAVPLLERITASYNWSARESALYLTYLAEAYDQANEPEAADATRERARELAVRVNSQRVEERLANTSDGRPAKASDGTAKLPT